MKQGPQSYDIHMVYLGPCSTRAFNSLLEVREIRVNQFFSLLTSTRAECFRIELQNAYCSQDCLVINNDESVRNVSVLSDKLFQLRCWHISNSI